tara:strand:- start:280 stop:540 length:261 start_codon:yes stop_codon:yes gene_type:complete
MKTIGKVIGYLMWMGAGILMFIFWLTAMNNWLGFLGIILAFILTPGLVVFPIIFWIVEGVFPAFYFMVWIIGIIGLVIAVFSSQDD